MFAGQEHRGPLAVEPVNFEEFDREPGRHPGQQNWSSQGGRKKASLPRMRLGVERWIALKMLVDQRASCGIFCSSELHANDLYLLPTKNRSHGLAKHQRLHLQRTQNNRFITAQRVHGPSNSVLWMSRRIPREVTLQGARYTISSSRSGSVGSLQLPPQLVSPVSFLNASTVSAVPGKT